MKTIVIFSLSIVLAVTLTVSCQKDVDNVRYPEFKVKLVISGFLSPDEKDHIISVHVNNIIYGDDRLDYYPRNITATLSDGIKLISLRPIFVEYPFSDKPDSLVTGFVFTSSELSVEEGKTYTLKVKSETGLSVESSCTVPYKRNLFPALDTVRITYESPYDDYKYTYLQSDFSFTDIKGEENYYALLSELTGYNSQNYPPRPENRILADPKYRCFNDKGIDGIRSKIPLGQIPPNGFTNDDSTFLKIYFLNTDKPYYDYHRSILNYSSGEVPFTEASPVYSNVSGGLGIFAAYTYDSIIVRLK